MTVPNGRPTVNAEHGQAVRRPAAAAARPSLRRCPPGPTLNRCIPRKSLALDCTKCKYRRRRRFGGLRLQRFLRPIDRTRPRSVAQFHSTQRSSQTGCPCMTPATVVASCASPNRAAFGGYRVGQSARSGSACAMIASTTSLLASAQCVRDRLRAHPDERLLYVRAKRDLAARMEYLHTGACARSSGYRP